MAGVKLVNRDSNQEYYKIIEEVRYKLCTKCQNYYPLTIDFFRRGNNNKYGFKSRCKFCTNKSKENLRSRHWKDGLLFCRMCGGYKKEEEFYANKTMPYRNYKHTNCIECDKKRENKSRRKNLGQTENLGYYLRNILNGIKTRGRKNNIEVSITLEDLLEQYKNQNGFCNLTNIKLTSFINKGKIPTNISVDRIDPKLNYTKDNIQLVCSRVNIIKLDDSIEDTIYWCKLIIRQHENNN